MVDPEFLESTRLPDVGPPEVLSREETGDIVTLQVPYGTFVYKVRTHRIVAATDLAVLRSHHREVVILQACHPRFFATHRYLVYAYPVRVYPTNGKGFSLGG